MEICNSIRIGECGVDLAMRNPGCLNHSRWLTTANRILLLCQRQKTIRESEDAGDVHHSRICSNVVCHKSPTRHAKMELGTFTRCSSSLDTSALSTRRLLTQSFTATRTSLTGESVPGHDDRLSTTHTRVGPSCTSQWTNTEVQGTEVTPTFIF